MKKRRKSKYEGKFPPGHKFGEWTVVNGNIHDSPARIDVFCVCGATKRVDVYTLVKGRSTNCGCQKIGENSSNWSGVDGISGTALYRNSLRSARLAENHLSYQDMVTVYNSQQGSCALTGETLKSDLSDARLERIDVSQPYVTGNVQWVHASVSPMTTKFGTVGAYVAANSIKPTEQIQNIFEKMGFKPASGG